MYSLNDIQAFLLAVMFTVLSGLGRTYSFAQTKWIEYKYSDMPKYKPHARYYLCAENEHHSFDEVDTRVPEDSVYVEEWVDTHGHKKCVVAYEGDPIPKKWTTNPFDIRAKCPWVWVGDRETEIDLTRTFNKFLVPGNQITLDLVLKLIHITNRTNLIYIESGTFKEIKFPGSGITIKADAE
jgi:hypothetical protein